MCLFWGMEKDTKEGCGILCKGKEGNGIASNLNYKLNLDIWNFYLLWAEKWPERKRQGACQMLGGML